MSATPIEIGHVEALFRYPVKSMRGEPLTEATLGSYGLQGDRRFAFRRLDARGGMPWLTASKLPELVLFAPERRGDPDPGEGLPTHVRTPTGEVHPILDAALAADVSARCGTPVQMMELRHGIFDETPISVIALETVREIARLSNTSADVRRFRPNVVVRSHHPAPFEDDAWVGGVLTFGAAPDAPSVAVTMRDERCAMLNIDPDDARCAPEVMKAVVRVRDNLAGVYATVTRTGRIAVGQPILLHR
jgi:uncharacterized protein YcbX